MTILERVLGHRSHDIRGLPYALLPSYIPYVITCLLNTCGLTVNPAAKCL